MDPQDRADVVPLKRDRVAETGAMNQTREEAADIVWATTDTPSPHVYRRMLEILFAPRADDEAA